MERCIDPVLTFANRRWWPACALDPAGMVTTEYRPHAHGGPLCVSERLAVNGCTHGLKAIGICWKQVCTSRVHDEFESVLANAAHAKNVPGRKADVNDAMWLAELTAYGLIRAGFAPNARTRA